jgi:putative transposase
MSGVHVPDVVSRDVVSTIEYLHGRTGISRRTLLGWVGLQRSRYNRWRNTKPATAAPDKLDTCPWELLEEERQAILDYHHEMLQHDRRVGYRTLTYEMLDNDVVACSESSVYRTLKHAGRLSSRVIEPSKKGTGFEQPTAIHEHWHIDISYLWEFGHKAYLVTVLDGKSRYILSHSVLTNIETGSIEKVLQKASERFPDARPTLITDNGSQFVSSQFRGLLVDFGFQQRRTSVNYPQANGKMERQFRTTKELLRSRSIIDFDDLVDNIDQIVDFYCNSRYHSALGFITPADAFFGREMHIKQLRRRKLDDARYRRKLVHSNLFNRVTHQFA